MGSGGTSGQGKAASNPQSAHNGCGGAGWRRYARPEDFALWGALLGSDMAKRCLHLRNAERRWIERMLFRKVQETAQQFRDDGASDDEAALYIRAYQDAFRVQLSAGAREIEIIVRS